MATEKRLIDANALADKVDESKYNNPHPQVVVRVNHRNEHDHFLRMILDAPTVDAVEVVRCKDCKWYKESKLMPPIKFCYRLIGNDGKPVGYNFSDDDFCSRGERKDNG